jgi:hypothetical protein
MYDCFNGAVVCELMAGFGGAGCRRLEANYFGNINCLKRPIWKY